MTERTEMYITKGGQKLRRGYTTGTCAAAAAKAAAAMLLTGREITAVRITTPKGTGFLLEVEDIRFNRSGKPAFETDPAEEDTGESAFKIAPAEKRREACRSGPPDRLFCGTRTEKRTERKMCSSLQSVSCAVRKDSGDDPDVTDGVRIYAEVTRSDTPGIRIDGGEGVGRVTKPGLDQPVGAAAINSTPRRMIAEAVKEAVSEVHAELFGAADQPALPHGFTVTISVPQGRALAEKTFNPKIGIKGGISILGTTGIVEPMSDEALVETIRTEIRVRRCEGRQILTAAPGSYGKAFLLEKYGFSPDMAVASSNFIRDTVKMAEEAGFTKLLFVGHIGKLVKVAGGIPNTHSKYGDHRMEILTRIARDQYASGKAFPEELASAIGACVSTDEAVRILHEHGMDRPVLSAMTRRIRAVMEDWADGSMQVEVIVFSNRYGELGKTQEAEAFLRESKAETRKLETAVRDGKGSGS